MRLNFTARNRRVERVAPCGKARAGSAAMHCRPSNRRRVLVEG
jgi:hypothetical protein